MKKHNAGNLKSQRDKKGNIPFPDFLFIISDFLFKEEDKKWGRRNEKAQYRKSKIAEG